MLNLSLMENILDYLLLFRNLEIRDSQKLRKLLQTIQKCLNSLRKPLLLIRMKSQMNQLQ
nr:MAG TPA: hypothetical protein [Bacteriophage sp.]